MQGNHEELEIFLQKCLISSCFNQKFSLKKGDHRFIEISSRKIRAVRFAEGALDDHDDAKEVGHDPMTWIPFFLDFGCPIFIKVSSSSHVLIRDSPSTRLNRDRQISLTRSTTMNISCALIAF